MVLFSEQCLNHVVNRSQQPFPGIMCDLYTIQTKANANAGFEKWLNKRIEKLEYQENITMGPHLMIICDMMLNRNYFGRKRLHADNE